MLLPYTSDRRPTRFPYATVGLLLLTAAITLGQVAGEHLMKGVRPGSLLDNFGIVPSHFRLFTLLTYPFLHDGLSHLVLNLLYLWVFGAGVEDAVGRRRFLLLYLAAGVVGGICQTLFTLRVLSPAEAAQPIVGASAACAGLVGLFAVRYYRAKLAFVGLPYQPSVTLVVLLFLGLEMGLGIRSILQGAAADGVAHWAHIGGFAFGLTCGLLLRLDDTARRDYLHSDTAVLLERSDPGAALRRCELLLAKDPDNPGAHRDMARAWIQLDDREQAAAHYTRAVQSSLARGQRGEAANLFAEMRGQGIGEREGTAVPAHGTQSLRRLAFTTPQLLGLGNALEEAGDYELAAEVLRTITLLAPHSPEAETALLRVALLYARHLRRQEEGRILARLFQERYPDSPLRSRATQLLRSLESRSSGEGDPRP